MILKQSTTFNRPFKLISSTDHISLKTGVTATVNISKNNGAFATAGGTVTELANGWYNVALTTTDTNTLGALSFYITGSGADDTDFADQVMANILGDTLPVNVTQINAVSTSSVTTVNANIGSTQAITFDANNLQKVDVEDWKAGV